MARKDKADPALYIDAQKLYEQIDNLDPIERIQVTTALIELLRDTLMVDLATLRRQSVVEAKTRLGMKPREIAEASNSSIQTIQRLLVEGQMMQRATRGSS